MHANRLSIPHPFGACMYHNKELPPGLDSLFISQGPVA